MKILGRAGVGPGEMPDYTPRSGDLIVQMTTEEWNAWRGLTGPSTENSFPLTPELVDSFVQLREAMGAAAKSLGMEMVPSKLRDAAAVMDGGATVLVPAAKVERCAGEVARMGNRGECILVRGHEGLCK